MRVAVFHNLPSGGAKRAMVEMIRQLRLAGDTVDVMAPSTADEVVFPSSDVASSVRIWPAAGSPLTLTRRPPLPVRIPELGRRLRRVEAVQRSISAAIDTSAYDAAFVHHCRFTQSPYVLRQLQTPTVYFCQEPYRIAYEAARMPKSAIVRLRLWAPGVGIARIDRANMAGARRVLANSFYSRESILRAYGRDSSVVYLGVNSELFRPASQAERRWVVSVGAIAPMKGHRLVIDALAAIPLARRPALRIIGDRHAAGEERLLHARAAAAGVVVSIETGLSDAALVAAYQGAIVAACASELEPFGLTALEAAACGTPVVAVREGGLREAVLESETGIFADDRNPTSIAAAINQLLTDPKHWNRLHRSGPDVVRERWTWERTGTALRAHLADVAGR